MRNIKVIKAEISKLREEYEAKVTMLEEEIVQVRNARGYVPVTPAYETWFEAGRSTMPEPSGGTGSSLDAGSMCDGLGKSYF